MRNLAKCAFTALLAVLSATAADAATPKTTKPSASSTPAMMQMPMVAPLFIEDGDFTSTLVLVNSSAVPTYADVTVRALDGKTVGRVAQVLEMMPNEGME